MNFNSQICTTREQSERLIALGLKKETADMYITNMSKKGLNYTDDFRIGSIPYCDVMSFWDSKGLQLEKTAWSIIPAWSLHRLIEMMPSQIKCRNGYDYANLSVNMELVQYRFYDTDYMHDECYEHFNDGNLYDNIIDCIEWLIKEGYFNKEYLEE